MAETVGLSRDRYIAALRENSPLLVRAARLDLRAPVPTCPGWYVATLVAHVGEVHRFWALHVVRRAQEQQQLGEGAFASCPGLLPWLDGVDAGTPDLEAIPDGLVAWFERGAEELITAFEDVGAEEAIWHWSGDNRAITHMRNQAMEITVHRWDAENAQVMAGHLAATSPIDEAIARDGVDQHFAVQIAAARRWGSPAAGTGETYHFHRTDGEGEWLVRFEGDDVTVAREHAKGDVAIRGTAEQLFLWLWGRIPADALEVHGDRALLERYRQLVPAS
ncbi:MAG TPA: maleylpyruvate isomerase family mycothiol-dependent enzyme [Chloroflexota bacterium]|nr:maleylpyruvate isomerase family mycothiol-dependent enzyme [Chloroflexota bacterium]